MKALATIQDLEARNISAEPQAIAEALLDAVSASIRDAAGSPISLTKSTITEIGAPSQWLPVNVYAPRTPTAVNIDGIEVNDYKLIDNRLWRRNGWVVQSEPSHVTITLEHGLDTVPADIINMVCMFVAAGIAEAETGFTKPRGRQYISIDDYREGFASGDKEIIDPTELPERVKNALRNRFAGSVAVTGGY